jgi:glycosyltransferase involved in cell wall biosynthesis
MGNIERPIKVMMLGLRGFPNVEGGVEMHVQNLSPLLVGMNCEMTVFVRSPSQPAEVGSEWNGVKFISLWAPKISGLEAILHSFIGVLYAAVKRPDILHIHAIGPSIMTPLARMLGLRVVVTHHGPDYDRQKWGRFARFVLHLGERLGMRWSNGRIVVSKFIADIVRTKYCMESNIIPNGVVISKRPNSIGAIKKFNLTPGYYVLIVSRMVPEKRHIDLIDAFINAKLIDWKLVIVGGSDQTNTYDSEVLEKAAGNVVVLTGFQRGLALQELYSNAGIFVLPSSHEGMPIVLLEALSYGLPVIASDIPANLEIGLPSENYFKLGDLTELEARLKQFSSKRFNQTEHDEILKWVAEKYNWNTIASKTLGVYKAVLNNSKQ